jgi:hypothetical protein
MQDKKPLNDKGQPHSYWGVNWLKGGNYVNGELCGLCEWTARYGEINSKEYYAR